MERSQQQPGLISDEEEEKAGQGRGEKRRGGEGRIGDGMEWRNLGLFSIDDN